MNNQTRIKLDEQDPHAPGIRQFLTAAFPSSLVRDTGTTLEMLTEAILASGQIRYGPRPSPESLVTMRRAISHHLQHQTPVPFVVPWGSEKPDGTSIDVAELCALKTMACLNSRIQDFYPPGAVFHLRLEDVSAPHLFHDRRAAARAEAAQYCGGLKLLIQVLGLGFIKPVLESGTVPEAVFDKEADMILPLMGKHLFYPEHNEALEKLMQLGWSGPVPESLKARYLKSYEKLYPDKTAHDRLFVLARYFAGALARKRLGLSAINPEWGGEFLELSFLPALPGTSFPRRVYYRTMPGTITSLHMAPWRCKGYLRVREDGIGAGLASCQTRQDYNPYAVDFEAGGHAVSVRADYVIET